MNRDTRQSVVAEWATKSFGSAHVASLEQRALRFLEEAIELFQACGGDPYVGHKLLDYVFKRPVGTVEQELGQVGVTALLVARAAEMSADDCEMKEIDRILSKDPIEFSRRNKEKNEAGFDALAYPVSKE